MSQENKAAEAASAADANNQAPDDYNDYVAWRGDSGEPGEAKSEAAKSDPSGEDQPDANVAESAGDPEPPDDDEEQESAADDGQQAPRRKSGYQKRIDKLTRDKRELEARLAALEERVNGKQKPDQEPEKAEPAAKGESEEGKPKVDDYDTYEQFTEALTDWKLEQRDKKQAAARQSTEAERQRKTALDSWNARADEVRGKLPDYDDVLESADDMPIPGYLQEALLESEIGPEMAYHLAKNRADLERIATLSPTSAVRELGKIEATLIKAPPAAPPTKKISSAPKPVTPLSGGRAGSQPSVYDDSLGDDYNAWHDVRKAQLKRK